MVFIEQFRISDDGKRMYINMRMNEASLFDDMYIKRIVIMTGDKVLEATSQSAPTENFVYEKAYSPEDRVRQVDLVLNPGDFNYNFTKPNFSSDLFFLYVENGGAISGCAPCWSDAQYDVAVTFDDKLLYQKAMGYTKELADTCDVSNGLVDFILLFNAFKAAVETEHFTQAVEFYNRMFGSVAAFATKGCGCHG